MGLYFRDMLTQIIYHIAQNFDRGNFDRYWLFKYLTENILRDDHCRSPCTCKRCIIFEQFDGLNFDGPAGKYQKRQNFPHHNFALYGSYRVLDKRAHKIHKKWTPRKSPTIPQMLAPGHIQLYAIDKLCSIIELSNSWCSSTVASPFWLIGIELNAVLCIVSECIVLPTVYYWVLIERETSYGNMGTVLKICNHIHSKKLECIIQVTRCPVILQYNNWILTILRQHYNIPIFS